MRCLTILLFVSGLLIAGCTESDSASSAKAPSSTGQMIASGELISVTLWKRPVQRPGELGENSGDTPPKGSYVQIYPNFILVTDPNGNTQLSLHGWYTDLRFKTDAQ